MTILKIGLPPGVRTEEMEQFPYLQLLEGPPAFVLYDQRQIEAQVVEFFFSIQIAWLIWQVA